MGLNNRQDGDARGRAAQPHHISAIAHMFFAEDAPAAAAGAPVRDLAVVAADADAGSALLTSCLVQMQADEQASAYRICLAEGMDGAAGALLPDARRGDGGPGDGGGIRVTDIRPAVGAAEASAWQRWRHFGTLGPAALGAWEQTAAAPQLAVRQPRWEALVWCATAAAAPRYQTLQTLGRLLKVLRPRRLEAVVAAAGGDATDAAGKLLTRLPAVAGDVALAVTPLGDWPPPADGGIPEIQEAALRAVAGRLNSLLARG